MRNRLRQPDAGRRPPVLGARASAALPRRWFALVVLVDMLLATTIALVGLGDKPFWRDEVASVSVAERPLGELISVLWTTDVNMGLYYLLLHGWLAAGSGEAWVRALSALFAVATVPVLALVGRRMFDASTGAVAGLLLALSPFFQASAEEARSYSLTLLMFTLSMLFFVEAAERGGGLSVAAYAVSATLAVYAGPFTAFGVAAQAAALLILRPPKWIAQRLAAALVGVAAASSPLALVLLWRGGEQVSWVPALNVATLESLPVTFAGSALLAILLGALVLQACVALLGSTTRLARWRGALVLGWLTLPAAALAAVSLVKSVFQARYLVASVGALALLGALGLVELTRRARPAAIVVAVLLAGAAASELERRERVPFYLEDLRAAAYLVADRSRQGDGLAFGPAFARVGFEYYHSRLPGSAGAEDFGLAPHGSAREVDDLYPRELAGAEFVRRLEPYKRVWVVGYPEDAWHPTPEPLLSNGMRVLRSAYRLAWTRAYGEVQVSLFVRRRLPALQSDGHGHSAFRFETGPSEPSGRPIPCGRYELPGECLPEQ